MTLETTLLIAVPILLALAVVASVTTARHRGERVAGHFRVRLRRGSGSFRARQTEAHLDEEAHQRYASAREMARPASSERAGDDAEGDAESHGNVGVSRRQLFNRGILGALAVGSGALGSAALAFLWPSRASGFGAKIRAGKVEDVRSKIADRREPVYVSDASGYLTTYPRQDLENARATYDQRIVSGIEEAGLVALFQKCPHLGCRVPFCKSSQWFECPCHGSKYNRVGEKQGGPAPRGMDSFPIKIEGERIVIDTGTIIPGQPPGTDTIGQDPEGPHCV